MAITSVGYGGTVDYPDYGKGVVAPSRYTLDAAGHWAPERVTSGADRTVSIAAGTGQGYGIRDTSDGVVNYQLPTVSSGHQWFMIVARRDWSTTKATAFTHIAGSTGGAALPTRQTNYGAGQDDQPIALVQITAGQQYPTDLRDLRCWAGDGGLVAVDTLALDYLDIPGTRVNIGSTEYTRILRSNGTAEWDIKRAPKPTSWTTQPMQNVAFEGSRRWCIQDNQAWFQAEGKRTGGDVSGASLLFVTFADESWRPKVPAYGVCWVGNQSFRAAVGTSGRVVVDNLTIASGQNFQVFITWPIGN